MTYLRDSSVLIDVINGRSGRPKFLSDVSDQNILLACCAVNVTELYMSMRPGEEVKTEKLLRSLEFYEVTWDIARLAGDLFRRWRQKGQTLGLAGFAALLQQRKAGQGMTDVRGGYCRRSGWTA